MKLSLSKENRNVVLQYLLIYFCFLNTSSKAANMIGDAFIVLTFVISLALIVTNRVRIYKKYFLFISSLFLVILLQHTLIQGNISINSVMNLLSKFLISYCAVYICGSDFLKRFVNVTVFLATASLVCFAISFTPLESILRSVMTTNYARNWMGNISYGRFIYHYMPGYPRNVGIYSEPGVFQIFLCLALFWILFENSHFQLSGKKKKFSIAVLIVTLITTASTAGYITFILILCMYYIGKNKVTWSGIGILIIGVIGIYFFSTTDIFQSVFIDKLQFTDGEFAGGTGNARLISIISDLSLVSQNIWGYGYSGVWSNVSGIFSHDTGSSVGITSILTVYGIPIAIIIYIAFVWAFMKVTEKPLNGFFLLIVFISSFLSQPWILTPVYLNMISYAFCYDNISHKQYNNRGICNE